MVYFQSFCERNADKAGSLDRSEQDNLVAVRRCPSRRQAEQYALVLTALGMQLLIVPEGNLATLYVAPEDAAKANDELTGYESESRERRSESARLHPVFPRIEVAMVYWAILLFFFAAARHEALSFDWTGEGAAQAGLILTGEWWRAVTALFLHVTASHLFANLVFGTAFLLLLAQVTGAGVASLSMVSAGAAGNALNAFVHSPTHTSIGASTAIFAGLGVLAALRQVWRSDRPSFSVRNWMPLAGATTLLVFLGFGGENTDILGHVLGFGSGIVVGWLLARWERNWPADLGLQWKCAGAAGAIVATAWVAAAFA